MKDLDKVQTLLPLGYLYLVVLGILKETAFLYQLDINILKYSSIMDVLISPIATMMSHPLVFGVILAIFIFCYNLPAVLKKHDHKPFVQKMFDIKKTKSELSASEYKDYYMFIAAKFLGIFLLSVYLGYGFAEGFAAREKIKENRLKFKYRLTYTTGESEDVALIENNSVYYFYVAKGEKTVTIAPVSGIKNIVLLKQK